MNKKFYENVKAKFEFAKARKEEMELDGIGKENGLWLMYDEMVGRWGKFLKHNLKFF